MADETGLIRASIVFAGKFNPAIFSPAWFAKYGLLSDDELKVAENTLVHPEISQFKVEHLNFEVQPTKFIVQTTSDPIVRILDIATVTFTKLVPHTPISALGMNYVEHFRLNDWKRRVVLGRKLAPIQPWGDWGTRLTAKEPEKFGGLSKLVMKEIYADDRSGERRIEIGPSAELPDLLTGVYMSINDHRDIGTDDLAGAAPAVEVLGANFEQSIAQSRKIVSDMLEYAKALKI